MAVDKYEGIIDDLARWVERFYADIVVTSPTLMNWELVSRIQQFNSAHSQPLTISIPVPGANGFTYVQFSLANTGTGYTGAGGIPLALPSPLQILQAYLTSRGNNESLNVAVTPTTITIGSTFTLTLTATSPGLGPFVLVDSFNTALLLPAVNIGTNTVTASASVFSAGAFDIRVKDQSSGVVSNIYPVTFQ